MSARLRRLVAGAVGVACVATAVLPGSSAAYYGPGIPDDDDPWFQRVATMPIYHNSAPGDPGEAEIAAASEDGRTIVYTEFGASNRLGFATLGDDAGLTPAGTVPVPGRPTSVDVLDNLALVAIDTTVDVTAPSGVLQVVDLDTRKVVASHDLGGMPDLVDVSPDQSYAAITIENERSEDVNLGELPQLPGGFLSIVDITGGPAEWALRKVDLSGLSWHAPTDPEPEHVNINSDNLAAVTLQENNHIVIVDLPSGEVRQHFTAGVGTVSGLDTKENQQVRQTGTVTAPREPEGVAWLDSEHIATAAEGDYHGGTRTWNVFEVSTGAMVHSSANDLENLAISYGQYPEYRASDRGLEPEALVTATYGKDPYLFVGLERANLVAVYDIDDGVEDWDDGDEPELIQGLPVGVSVEGILPIPQRGMLVVVSKDTDDDDEIWSSLTTFRLTSTPLADELLHNRGAPSIVAGEDEEGGYPIPFGALSGLCGVPGHNDHIVAVNDDTYGPTNVFRIDVNIRPAEVVGYLPVTRDGIPMFYDAEGIAVSRDGGYWIAVEGDDGDENLLVRTDDHGRVQSETGLPDEIADGGTDDGFEGVAVVTQDGVEHVWVAIQREWADNKPGETTLARYTPSTGEWAFAAYPLDPAPDGAWVGVSELTAPDNDTLLVLERDNRRGEFATVKQVTKVDISTLAPVPAGQEKPVATKELVRDILPDLAAGGGLTHDKPEGLAIIGGTELKSRFGELIGIVDNDGVEDAPGETVLLRLGNYDVRR